MLLAQVIKSGGKFSGSISLLNRISIWIKMIPARAASCRAIVIIAFPLRL